MLYNYHLDYIIQMITYKNLLLVPSKLVNNNQYVCNMLKIDDQIEKNKHINKGYIFYYERELSNIFQTHTDRYIIPEKLGTIKGIAIILEYGCKFELCNYHLYSDDDFEPFIRALTECLKKYYKLYEKDPLLRRAVDPSLFINVKKVSKDFLSINSEYKPTQNYLFTKGEYYIISLMDSDTNNVG